MPLAARLGQGYPQPTNLPFEQQGLSPTVAPPHHFSITLVGLEPYPEASG